MRRLTVLAIAGVFAAAAFAQHDPNSVWPQFKANDAKSASVAAPGPAAVLDWYVEPDDPNGAGTIPSPGGFTLDGDGYIYYKSRDDTGDRVYRLDPADGLILAQSVIFPANSGSYGGVAVGIDRVYTTIYNGVGDTKIVVLDKTTLATLHEFDGGGLFQGLRGTPLVSNIPNDDGHSNLYVYDRNGFGIHAVDSVTGDVMWSYYNILGDTPFSQVGPMWQTTDGRQAFAHFQNVDDPFVGVGLALADNGDNTYEVLWENAGPHSKNWIGSGALSFDGHIYVTTYWDLRLGVLWKINRDDGSVIWDVPWSDDPNDPNAPAYNYGFGRPAVVGNRVYCGGGWGQIVCYEDLGNSYQRKWEMRDDLGEYTCVSAAADGDTTYVYGSRQSDGPEVVVALSDDGDSYTEIGRYTLDLATATQSLYANNSCTIDASGNVYIGLGRPDGGNGVADPAAIYKFKPGLPCVGDLDGDGDTDHSDLGILLSDWGCPGPPVVLYDSGGFEGYSLADLPGQDGWTSATNPEDPQYTYEEPEVVNDPTGHGMGHVVWFDAPDGSELGWVGADRDAPGSTGGIVTVEWDQYRDDTGDNFWVADDISYSGWWAIQWDMNGSAHASGFDGPVPLTAGQWQHVTYTLDTAAGQATVDVDGDFNSAGFGDTIIDGIEFELAGTAVMGDGPAYIDNLVISEVPGCSGDLDGDGDTDHSDLGILLSDWGCVP
ncbi:MAG TPA: PQQ-binding-like beta-propeller repeat protein [Phycisphaerae bacterium]|nr:PQQ-binding-like beta-propeller repeat protein [Phycisphaerae bacterium]